MTSSSAPFSRFQSWRYRRRAARVRKASEVRKADRLLWETGATRAETGLFLTMLCLVGLVIGIITWCATTYVNEVAYARGSLQPSTRTAVITHPTGGKILARHAEEGDVVAPGDLLLTLDMHAARAELAQTDAALIKQRSLKKTAETILSAIGEAQDNDVPTVAVPTVQIEGLENTRSVTRLYDQWRGLMLRIDGAKQSLNKVEAAFSAARTNAALARDLLARQEKLASKGHSSTYAVVKAKSDVAGLEGQVGTLRAEKAQAQTAIELAQNALSSFLSAERERYARALKTSAAELEALAVKKTALKDALSARQIRAIAPGRVVDILGHKPGHFLAPGALAARIVPPDDTLIAEVSIKPRDMAFVKVGQSADILFDGIGRQKSAVLPATLVLVSATSQIAKDGTASFRAHLRADEAAVKTFEAQYPLVAGMVMEARIKTGRKSILEYLLKPVLALADDGFRER